jgi:lipid A ethanolaminephosphotransferase
MRRPLAGLISFAQRLAAGQVVLSIESVVLLASLFFALFCNSLFLSGMLDGYDMAQPGSWLLGASLLVVLLAVHFVLVGIVATRWTTKPLLALLFVVTAFAVHFMTRYKVFLDTAMLRNVLATDVREARDLMTWSLIPQLLLYAGLPLWVLSRIRLQSRSIGRALLVRAGWLALALVVAGGAIFASFQDIASLMRNNRELRFLVTPANYIYSLTQVARSQAKEVNRVREPVGADAVPGAGWGGRRSRWSWSWCSVKRHAPPTGAVRLCPADDAGTGRRGRHHQLRRRDQLRHRYGTSLPCIFSPWGRAYDETRIRNSESVLDVVARAGSASCGSITSPAARASARRRIAAPRPGQIAGALCGRRMLRRRAGRFVEAMVSETPGNLLIVLHQMGNHGPAYFKRYPDAFKQFTPACEDPDLPRCSNESIVNAYDNAIRYTDHVVASLVRTLREHEAHDSALLYVSDHGESLGEKGLFLHGVPFKIAPDVQTKVPMVMWFSPGYRSSFALDEACVGQVAATPLSHDHIFHSLLGLLDVKTSAYTPEMDFSAKCRRP